MGCNTSTSNKQERFHDAYELGGGLGQTSLSGFFQVVSKDTMFSPSVAKFVDCRDNGPELEEARREAKHWKLVGDHENIMKLLKIFEDSSSFVFVMETFTSTMYDKAALVPHMSEKAVFYLVKQMITAISHVHQAGLVHRDVRLENFFVGGDSGATVKLTNFALSVPLPAAGGSQLTEPCGNAPYRSPEMIAGSYTEKTDVWSVGVAIYRMLYGQFPYRVPKSDKSIEAFSKVIMEGKQEPDYRLPCKLAKKRSEWPDQMVHIVQTLLTRSPDERSSAANALQMPFTRVRASKRTASANRFDQLDTIEEGSESDDSESTESGGDHSSDSGLFSYRCTPASISDEFIRQVSPISSIDSQTWSRQSSPISEMAIPTSSGDTGMFSRKPSLVSTETEGWPHDELPACLTTNDLLIVSL